MEQKQLDFDRGVSPVVGVILMVAITVILAAVIGTFVLDLGQDQTVPPRGGFDFEDGSGEVDVVVVDPGNLDSAEVGEGGSTYHTFSSPSAGDSTTVTSVSGSGTLTVTGTNDGKTTVVAAHEYSV